jgi:hypothetical protein
VHDCENDSSFSGNAIENTKWEPTNQIPMNTSMNNGIHSRPLGNGLKCGAYFIQELMAQALTLLLIPVHRFLDVSFGLFTKLNGESHSRFRISPNAFSAQRPVSPSAS